LSTIKKPKQPKNVLVKNEINYWPTLDDNQTANFVKLLEMLCSNADTKSLISLGLESTIRYLKGNELQTLVIANEISPKFFGKHLISMAYHKNPNIQVFIIPKLKDITKQLLKVPSIVFSIKRSGKLAELSDFYKSLCIQEEVQKHYYTTRPVSDVSIKKRKLKPTPDRGTPVTLLRKSSDNRRSFVPMDVEESASAEIKDSSDFISLSKFNISSSSLKSSAAPLYRPIKIAKVAGNPSRKQKKS